ncbi:RNA 2',3'-cyclic phosphodiesterase [Bartonella sp. CB60]|uniref:RNA 2',3'-cyclic phosphodiesterase n=1 Tax=Bartonella sp. CB60 TaxID=3113619 RepID=UPI00300DF505
MLRLFSALQIPQEITKELISLQHGLPQVQWMNPQNFHITLYFFGEVERSLADEIICALNTIKLPPFQLRTHHSKVFDSETIPDSLVVRIEPCETLNLLHEQIQCIQERLKLPRDQRKFTPHITIARLLDVKPEDLASYVSSRRGFSLPLFDIDHFVLFSSPSLDDNVPYIVQGSWKLQAQKGAKNTL